MTQLMKILNMVAMTAKLVLRCLSKKHYQFTVSRARFIKSHQSHKIMLDVYHARKLAAFPSPHASNVIIIL